MNASLHHRISSAVWLTSVTWCLIALPVHADSQFSAKRLNQLDKLGAFPPDFKTAVHDYVNVKQAQVDTANEEAKLRSQVPGLEQQAVAVQTKIDSLNVELADYDHTDETDFVVLQQKMNDAKAKLQEKLLLAQVFVWSYPTSSHLVDAQTFLQQTQKQIADELQAEKDAAAAIAAARAKLLQRVHDHDLSLPEWKSFLTDMSQDDVVKYLGTPPQKDGYYWLYKGDWTFDPVLNQKVGLQINFNGGRVIGVAETAPSSPTAPASQNIGSE